MCNPTKEVFSIDVSSPLQLIEGDSWLNPYANVIEERHHYALVREQQLTRGTQSLADWASGHLYFGLHRTPDGWTFREWAPNATAIYLTGDFNHWNKEEPFALRKINNGIWEGFFSIDTLRHGQHYKILVEWDGGSAQRIPAWCRRVVQDNVTHLFSAQVWEPQPYIFRIPHFCPQTDPLLIYEAHIGMATARHEVGTYEHFRLHILPRIHRAGYNAIQLMAIQEHPYYGSFGYHVSNFFAPSSRFGTPEELKALIDEAHSLGIAVIMDIVHSHAVKNLHEGLDQLDGSIHQYFHTGVRRYHTAWDSLVFDYGQPQTLHFLLSNCKYWLDEFRFDGFRFDGVTSMIYLNHGLEQHFTSYDNYFDGTQDTDAIVYLTLANRLIHDVNPHALTIAEEVSGMPGLAAPFLHGGYGFDYRLAMNIPDFWIKLIKEQSDEHWRPSTLWYELTNHRPDELTISYAESHDQALVGDKTIIFRLADAEMYTHMQLRDHTLTIDRAIALHKIIRLITFATANGGYLNFMGNEFGHPEWIDFPRKGNDWSYHYARRQWNLVDDPYLKYTLLAAFDRDMLLLTRQHATLWHATPSKVYEHDEHQVLAFTRGYFLFVFNFNPTQSFTDYSIPVTQGSYHIILNTDHPIYGGFGAIDHALIHHVDNQILRLYLPARTALVLALTSSPREEERREEG
ncbi:MAG: alpha amylase C-terminal domain-containing protein [Tannerellaceae bacterium]|jgi:1,4-alpha-glucan branching enzyme|nr:alpha amylase C-terminal domain-containing protein [Tannerellaceae bacterium]